jgi:transcriptional regulator with XRE-family HTH domain
MVGRLNSNRAGGGDRMIESPTREEISSRLALVIRNARQRRRLSIVRLSSLADVSRRTIREIERGDGYLPTLSTLLDLSRPLGLTLGEIGQHIDPASP